MQRKQTASGMGRTRRILLCGFSGLFILSLAAFLLFPVFSNGLKQLLNSVFDASEAVNPYIYDRFPVAGGTSVVPAALLLGVAALSLLMLCITSRGLLLPLLLAAALAAVQAYFGLSLPAPANVACFGFLATVAVGKQGGLPNALRLLACVLVISLLTALFLPGTNSAIETASEQVRDLLDNGVQAQVSEGVDKPLRTQTRHENRRDLTDGTNSTQAGQEHRLVTVDEQQLAQPKWIDYLKIALLCLAVPLALAAPFLPFLWINRVNRKTAERYACLDAADHAEAVAGMFALVIAYLDACGVGDPASLHSRRLPDADDRLTDAYCDRYQQCAAIWQKTVYSDHPLTDEERAQVSALLDETEAIFYDQADRKTRLRLRYLCCLHG